MDDRNDNRTPMAGPAGSTIRVFDADDSDIRTRVIELDGGITTHGCNNV